MQPFLVSSKQKQSALGPLISVWKPQNFQVIKKNAIIEPFKISTPSKKISLPMTWSCLENSDQDTNLLLILRLSSFYINKEVS